MVIYSIIAWIKGYRPREFLFKDETAAKAFITKVKEIDNSINSCNIYPLKLYLSGEEAFEDLEKMLPKKTMLSFNNGKDIRENIL